MENISRKTIFLILIILLGSTVLSNTSALDLVESDEGNPIQFIPPVSEQPQIIQGVQKSDVELPPGVNFQNEREAWDADNKRLADELGITKDSVDRAVAFQDSFTQYARRVRARYPNQISGVWVEPVPATIGKIRFVGEVPSALLEEIQKLDRNKQIILLGGGAIKEGDHSRRVQLVTQVLGNDLHLENFVCSYNVFEDVIDIEIARPKNTSSLDETRIIEAIRKQAVKSGLKGVVGKFHLDHIRIHQSIGTEPIINLEAHFGGVDANVLFNYSPICTTGWSVIGPFGDGLITAGHCAQTIGGLKSYTTNLFQFGMTRIYYINNWFGDAAYYNIGFGYDDFYADYTDVRDTVGVMPIQSMLGKFACRFGRKSGVSCGHKIISVTACKWFGSVYNCNLAQATKASSLTGDSGGPWYRLNIALGVHIGSSSSFSYFMPAKTIENYWGLTIKH